MQCWVQPVTCFGPRGSRSHMHRHPCMSDILTKPTKSRGPWGLIHKSILTILKSATSNDNPRVCVDIIFASHDISPNAMFFPLGSLNMFIKMSLRLKSYADLDWQQPSLNSVEYFWVNIYHMDVIFKKPINLPIYFFKNHTQRWGAISQKKINYLSNHPREELVWWGKEQC